LGKMKVEVHTIRFGNPFWMERCSKTLDAWCKRHGLERHIWTDETALEKGYPDVKFCEVDMLRAFIRGDSDQMMYVDADVLVHPEAPFPHFGPGMHARCHARRVNNPYWIPWCIEHFGEEPDNGGNYRNAGIWVVDRDAAKRLLRVIEEPYIEGIMEQNHFNWWLMLAEREGLKIWDLDRKWHSFPKEFKPAWMFHVYGKQKASRFADLDKRRLPSAPHPKMLVRTPSNMKRNLISIKPRQTAKRTARSQWPMHMDEGHVLMLQALIEEHSPKVAVEIGSHDGVSTQAFLDALDSGFIEQFHIIELHITPALQARIDACKAKDRITVHLKPYWEARIEADLVFIDGDHRWPALADLATALALKTPVIAMHDTNSLTAGIESCWGSEMAASILREAPGRLWSEDKEKREGQHTQRGFGWSVASTKDGTCASRENTPL
jgi:hypothetical protein